MPFGLLSLWTPWILYLAGLCTAVVILRDEENAPDFRLVDSSDPSDNNGDKSYAGLLGRLAQKELGQEAKNNTLGILKFVEGYCSQLELETALQRIERFRRSLQYRVSPVDYRTQIRTLRETMEDQLQGRHAYYVKKDKARVFYDSMVSWKKTWVAFEGSRSDIMSAVNCYLTDNNTACVFHLMRVAEIGLRALARERRVKLKKNRPLEWADWHEILSGIQAKVDAIANKPRGMARGSALEFYNGLLGEFGAFKDTYRNNVMHSRDNYDENQSLSVMNHVREFMERLSSKVEENQKRQIAWGRM